MSTLIKNVGILDARKATPEQIAEIGKLNNVGCLIVSQDNRGEFVKVSMENVGKMSELDHEYRLHTGPLDITKQMLEDSAGEVKLCVVGPLTVSQDVGVELLQAKLGGLHLIGPASVPEHLYGAFMSQVKEITGTVAVETGTGKLSMGKITISNAYLTGLDDHTDLSVTGNVTFEEEVDPGLFARKIASLRVMGVVKCNDKQEAMMRKALVDSDKTKVKLTRFDFHYVPGGTIIDTFTLMTVGKQTISCYGLLILDKEVTSEILREKDISFEAGTVYFPKSIMQEMVNRLSSSTKGLPYEPGTLGVITGEQCMTSARLNSMPDASTLVVIGELEVDEGVSLAEISTKIATVDNYGEIRASKDIASILQGKLRQDEGSITCCDDESEASSEQTFDSVIQNVATYTF